MQSTKQKRKRDPAAGSNEGERLAKQIKETQQCYDDNYFLRLGVCDLDEISYYNCLRIPFEPKQILNEDYILTINRLVNDAIVQVRPYQLTDVIQKNKVLDILTLIDSARTVLYRQVKKEKYDEIILFKNQNQLNLYDDLILELANIGDLFKRQLFILQNDINNFLTEFKSDVQMYDIDDSSLVLKQFVLIRVKILFTNLMRDKTKLLKIKRSTTLNRLQVDWPILLPEEETMTREEIANVIKRDFEQFGEIKFVYVCPINKTRAIIEFATSESVNAALSVNNDNSNRYKAQEFIIANYYSPTLFQTMRNKIENINQQIDILKNNIIFQTD
ncbi:hypothetical protein [Lonomia obliqua multiple nucleopolyhedrovirus]|uniref:RRM domain-containing protein n=1 Tax=Lonomia obliqua multiple nucleopolyhedrovirus TaxID=134394 RepID=A0A126FCC7_9ABAC|nr:hypothetical protein [Lonomia obliqua multiple nucleopolyhedrovirus]AKN81060.1 hypothetical protein [Lonomia obliqua multiple nucleopolyhedrovirus]